MHAHILLAASLHPDLLELAATSLARHRMHQATVDVHLLPCLLGLVLLTDLPHLGRDIR